MHAHTYTHIKTNEKTILFFFFEKIVLISAKNLELDQLRIRMKSLISLDRGQVKSSDYNSPSEKFSKHHTVLSNRVSELGVQLTKSTLDAYAVSWVLSLPQER